ncbi:MAG: hypothetical protein ACK5Z2_11565 [Bacteroidota bacterium]|jgi:hypothetical protein
MKTIILFLALFVSATGFAAPETSAPAAVATSSQQYIVNTIRQAIHLPEVLKSSTGMQRILVVFSVNTDGSVTVQEVGSNNLLVKASLTQQFQSLRFAETGSSEMYSIWLNFSVL